MKKYFEFKEEDRILIVKALNSIDVPRVISKITRRSEDVWLLTIDGSDRDIPLFLQQLEELGLPLI